nr:glycoside hydrolase family 97 catalytic domain-containing protein [Armatimonadota bacterium]
TWSWWSQDTGDLALQKHYVDFAQSMGWEYNLVDAGWTDWNNKNPAPQITELVNYARDRGVRILVWCFAHDLDTPEKRAARLPLWRSWGVAGFKADFFDSDSRAAMQLRDDILREAWANHLLVNFHGDQTPRGHDRTWPNFLTREGVRGAEYYKFGPYPTPTYNCTLPFTRNVPGPMDYTPVTFSTKNRTTTAAHELALSVVFQSGLLHLADSPESYNSRPAALQFLKAVPADWDETRFLDGYPARYACLARRHGNDWFVGMINAGSARSMSVPLRFLKGGSYRLDLFYDGKVADTIEMTTSTVSSRTTLQVAVPANGGFAAHLMRLR